MTALPDDSAPLDLRDTAKGIAIRAGLLSAVALVLGAWIFSLAAKAAGGLVKVLVGVILLAAGGSYAAWEIRKVRKDTDVSS